MVGVGGGGEDGYDSFLSFLELPPVSIPWWRPELMEREEGRIWFVPLPLQEPSGLGGECEGAEWMEMIGSVHA